MKKLILIMMAVLCLSSCGEDANVSGGDQAIDPVQPQAAPLRFMLWARTYRVLLVP